MCEVIHPVGALHNSTSATSEWSQRNDSEAMNCDEKRSSSLKELPIKSYGLKGAKEYSESSRARLHHHRLPHSKSLKNKNTVFPNLDRYHRTAAVLRWSGLLQISQSISKLQHNNEILQSEINKLRQVTREHSVQLQEQMRRKLEKESEASGVYNEEGQKLLAKLSQSLL